MCGESIKYITLKEKCRGDPAVVISPISRCSVSFLSFCKRRYTFANMGPKRLQTYKPQDKLRMVNRAKEIGIGAAAKEFGVAESNLRRWRKNEAAIVKIPKNKKRVGNRTAKWPQLESALLEWIREQRKEGRPVSRALISVKAKDMARERGLEDFSGGSGWCTRFMRRNKLSLRVKTSVGQKLPDDWKEKAEIFLSFVNNLVTSKNIEHVNIFNMDEVPLSFDCPPNRTVDEKGVKSVFVKTTGHEKTNFTVVLACSATGVKMDPMLIFKRKTIPNEAFPDGVMVQCNPKGWMTEDVMEQWVEDIFRPNTGSEASLLVLDSMRAHITPKIKLVVKGKNVNMAVIPGGLTKKLQPLDITVNHVFKSHVRRQWESWMVDGIHSYTKSGHMRKAGFAEIAMWVKNAWNAVKPSTIVKAFRASGIISSPASQDQVQPPLCCSASTSTGFPDAVPNDASEDSSNSLSEEDPELDVDFLELFQSSTEDSDFDGFEVDEIELSKAENLQTSTTKPEKDILSLFNSDSDDSDFLGFE